jgi:hypothetical protein
MYSRRTFLMKSLLFTPFLVAPLRMLKKMHEYNYAKTAGKFMKKGWLLQEGDV